MKSSELTDRKQAKTRNAISIITWIALITAACVAALNNWGAGRFSPDSWAYFELSQTIAKDFYRINHLRSFWTADYSAAFPPLWPTLIFMGNALFSLGPDVAIVLNIIILLLIAVVTESIAKATFNVRGPGALVALVLLLHPGFFSEIVAGRAIPLFVLLGFTALRLLIMKEATNKVLRFGALGAVLAAMFMTRFDGALWFVVLFPIVLTLKPGKRGVFAFCAAYAVGVAPWIVYSMTHFDMLLVSDNSWVARALDPNAFVTDFPPGQGPTIADNPAFAIETVMGRVKEFGWAVVKSPGRLGTLVLTVYLIMLLFMAPWRRLSLTGSERSHALSFMAVGVAIASASPSYLLTGYFDGRYFSFAFAFLVFLVLLGIWISTRPKTLRRVSALAVSIAAVAITLNPVQHRSSKPQIGLSHESELAVCLGLEPNHAPILAEATQAARLTALYGIRTSFVPRNFFRDDSEPAVHTAFLDAYGIEYALDPSGRIAHVFGAHSLYSVSGCGLDVFRISLIHTPTQDRRRL